MEDQGTPQKAQSPLHIHSPMVDTNSTNDDSPMKPTSSKSSSSNKGTPNVKKVLLASPKSKAEEKTKPVKGKEKDKDMDNKNKSTKKEKKGKDVAKDTKSSSKTTPNKSSKSEMATPAAKPSANEAKSSAKKKVMSASAKKKKIGELKEKESAIKEAFEKLKKEKSRWDGKLNKLESSTAPAVKFPVKDELILSTDPSGKPSLPLPEPYIKLDQYSPEFLTDAIGVWDFLNVFCKQLGILNISWEDFMDLMKFNGRASTAFMDLYCGPLRLILSDPTLSSKLSQAIPKKMNIVAFVNGSGVGPEKQYSENALVSTGTDDFDNAYNGLKLLPKKLKAEMVDSLRCQCIIRAILLRLEPVRHLRKAVAEVSSALHTMQSISMGNDNMNISKLNQVNRDYWSGPSPQKLVRFDATTPMKASSNVEETPSRRGVELSAETMVVINTPKSKSKSKTNGLNKDAIFNITSDCVSRLDEIYSIARALEGTELHNLTLGDKVRLLKVLCDACYDSKRIREMLENHADERASKIQDMNRMKREQHAKLREISAAKKQAAIEACRQINMEASNKKGASKGKNKKGNGKSTGNSSSKDSFDPSTDQLNAMIDDLVMLEAYGIDTVVDDIAIEEADSEGEQEDDKQGDDSNEEDEEAEYRGNRRLAVASRAKALDRKKAVAERVQRNSTIVVAYEKIAYAMETKNERDLRGAIKAAERAGFKGVNEDDEVFCTQMLKQVYRLMHDIETKAKEDKVASQHERALQEYFVRTESIGTDRNHSVYWHFIGEENKLFVQQRQLVSQYDGPIPPSSGKESDDLLCKVFASRPNRFAYSWKVYTSNSELWRLWEALDDRGEREKMLKDAIKARFELEEPTAVYQTTGSDWIGRKVQRKFGKKSVVGTIVGWLPPTDEDPPLWHVFHNDGDEEDLEEHEVVDGLLFQEGKDEKDDKMDVDSGNAEENSNPADGAEPIPHAAMAAQQDEVMEIVEVEQEEPKLAKQNYGVSRSNHYARGLPPLVGVQGIRTELSRLLTPLSDSLKKRGGNWSRETRKNLDNLIRVSETAQDFSGVLLEIEELVRSTQECEDKLDADEILARQDQDKQEMQAEGWIFDKSESDFIGRWARRFFKGFGASDGIVTALLKDEDGVLFRMVHQDGDWEDLSLEDLVQALHNYDDNLLEDENDDSESTDEEEASPEENEEDEEDQFFKVGDVGVRLWPSKEIRQLWMDAVKAANSTSEISVALSILEKQFYYFGVIDNVDPSTPLTLFKDPTLATTTSKATKSSDTKNSSYKSSSGGHHSMLSPRKAKKRAIGEISRVNKELELEDEFYDSRYSESKRGTTNNQGADFYNSGRPSRSAAQKVASYAE